MIYCPLCGSPNPAQAVLCEVCGSALPRTGATPSAPPPPGSPPPGPPPAAPPPRPAPAPHGAAHDGLSSGEQLGIFAGNVCLSPLLGVVLYFVWRGRFPTRAGQACALTKWAVGLWVAFFLLAMVAGVLSEL